MRRLRALCARDLFGDDAPDLMKIGRFLLLSQLGTGGQGAVFVAEDPTLDRKVALKRLTATDPRHKQQLRHEGQALARISHPNVVAVHEVGEDETGQPFLVMELVDGQPLHHWLREASRTWETIVDVLIPVGHGLAALHEAGVVHRDVKPHNIVITASGKAKLVDLGIAMMEAKAEATAPGVASDGPTKARGMPGTVGYMAPEHLDGQADARSDQFSFCVTLFEALYGVRPPWSLTRPESLHRRDPATRSFGGQGGKKGAASERSETTERAQDKAAANVQTMPPRRLVQVLAKGLQHAPGARYEDMTALLRALEKLRNPPRRWPLASLAIALAAGMSTALFVRGAATNPCDDEHAAQRLWLGEARDGVQQAFFASGSPAAEPTFTAVDGMLGEATRALDERLGLVCDDDPSTAAGQVALAQLQARRDSLEAIVSSLTDVSAPELADTPMRLAGPLLQLRDDGPRDACEQTEAILEPTPALKDAEAFGQRAVAAGVAGRFDEALTLTAEALALVQDAALAPVSARLHLVRGRLAIDAQQLDVARRELDAARSQAETLGCDGLGSEALALLAKAHAIDESGSLEEAAQASRMALEKLDRMGIEGARRAEALNSRGLVLQRQREHEGAIVMFREAIVIRSQLQPPRPLEVAQSMLDLGISQGGLGQTDTAIATLLQAQAQWSAALWPDHPSLYKVHKNLAKRYLEKGDLVASERELTRALALVEAGMGADSPRAAYLHIALSNVLDFQKEFEAALEHATRADEIFVARYGKDDLRRLGALEAVGVVCMDAGWMDRAIAALEQSLALQAKSDPGDHVSLAIGRGQLARARVRNEEPELARMLYETAVGPFKADPTLRTHPFYPELLLGWGETLVTLGRLDEAARALDEAVAWWDQSKDNPERLAHARWWLAQAQCPSEPALALALARKALDYFDEAKHETQDELRTSIADFIDHGCSIAK